MKRSVVWLAVVAMPLFVGAGWSGDARLSLLGRDARMTARLVTLDPAHPARRRAGSLTFMGGVVLTSPDPAFGGYSAMAVDGDRFTLLSDDGNIVRFRLKPDWRAEDVRFAALPAGPATGWTKRSRDSESMVVDVAGNRAWVGFEGFNQIWRYDATLTTAQAGVAPAAMANWRRNGGIETMARLADGRFVAISESKPYGESSRVGLVWAADPVDDPVPAFRFRYRPAPGFDPADMTQLPDGRLIVLERRFDLPFRWSNRLVLIDPHALTPGSIVEGREIARLAAPLIHDNFEGIAARREGAATVIWLVSDDNRLPLQRSLLLKFRLDDRHDEPSASR